MIDTAEVSMRVDKENRASPHFILDFSSKVDVFQYLFLKIPER
jgi:hypothetical protein